MGTNRFNVHYYERYINKSATGRSNLRDRLQSAHRTGHLFDPWSAKTATKQKFWLRILITDECHPLTTLKAIKRIHCIQTTFQLPGSHGWSSLAVMGTDLERARRVASQLRAGRVVINNMTDDPQAPWGGFKYSGVGREYGKYGIEAFLEPKAILE
jgi:hypothetical protein